MNIDFLVYTVVTTVRNLCTFVGSVIPMKAPGRFTAFLWMCPGHKTRLGSAVECKCLLRVMCWLLNVPAGRLGFVLAEVPLANEAKVSYFWSGVFASIIGAFIHVLP